MSDPGILLLFTKLDSLIENVKKEKKGSLIQFFEPELEIKPSFQVLSVHLRLREEELDDYPTLKELLFLGLRKSLKDQKIDNLFFGGIPILKAIKDPNEINTLGEALINSDCAIIVCATTIGSAPSEVLRNDLRNIIRGLIPKAHFLFVPEVISVSQQDALTLELEYNMSDLFGSGFPQVLSWMLDWVRQEFDRGSQLLEKYSCFGDVLVEIVQNILIKSIQESSSLLTFDINESIFFLWNTDFFYQIVEYITKNLQESLKELKMENNIEKQILVHLGIQALKKAGTNLFGCSFNELIDHLQRFLEKERAIKTGTTLSQTLCVHIAMVLEEFSCILSCEKGQRYFTLPKSFLDKWIEGLKRNCSVPEKEIWNYIQEKSKNQSKISPSKSIKQPKFASSIITIPSDLPANDLETFTNFLVKSFPNIIELFKEKIEEEQMIKFTDALQGLAPYEEVLQFKPDLAFADWLAAQKNSSKIAILEDLFIAMEDILENIKETYSIEGSSYFNIPTDMLMLLSFRNCQATFSQIKHPNFDQYKLKALFQIFWGIRYLKK